MKMKIIFLYDREMKENNRDKQVQKIETKVKIPVNLESRNY